MDWMHALLLLGIILFNCPISVLSLYGNLITYIFSVFFSIHEDCKGDIDISWLLGVLMISYSIGLFATDFIKRRFGVMITLMTGTVFVFFGYALTYFSVKHSAWAISLTYMLMVGIGDGIVVGTSMLCMATAFKGHEGLASSVPVASVSMGGVALNQLLTRYINPDNLSPDGINEGIMYFKQPRVISRVPSVFLVIAGIIAICHTVGFVLTSISFKISSNSDKKPKVMSEVSALYTTVEIEPYTLEKRPDNNVTYRSSTNLSSPETSIDTGCNSPINPITATKKCSECYNDDIKPLQVLRSIEFYVLWLSCFSETICNMVDINYYKLFGETWIMDDNFLAFIASWSSIQSCVFQLGCGYSIDRFGEKNALIGHLAISCFFMFLWYFTAMTSKWLYLVWSSVLQSVHNNLYASFPIFVLKAFGKSHYTTNNGLMFTALIAGTLLSPPLSSFVLSSYGWFWLFFSSAALPFSSLILVVIIMPAKWQR